MLSKVHVIVTGAGAGIGKEIVTSCLSERAHVVACDISEDSLNELKASYSTNKLSTYTVDVADYDSVKDFFKQIKATSPGVNALVNNAGIYLAQNLLTYSEEDINKVIDVNVKGAVYFSQFFGKYLIEKDAYGTIVNMSSVSALEGSSDALYGLSKAAILGLTKSCAMNFSPYIRVNSVAPTMVDTSMMDNIPTWRKQEYLEHQLIKTPVTPRDVADTVLFLLSDKAKHYTGSTFDLNNGGYLR
ncbi:SDR family NAD(P)-dependent oxidoreductase [Priestia flexa]|uniref:SDR family NAD(P)-dependent oxidoreductase n=1 Tax=Priestia flexa TaxID=86664 RepID=UPI00240E98A5|nr:SDR family oxidoreductase [Priestia flexa]WEZ07106.1 SDR family NAD(P)-dependent oxidoreductase [Priestia flexa]